MNRNAFSVWLPTLLLLVLTVFSIGAQTPDPILDASQLYLTKKHDAQFIFDFKAGDRIEIWTNREAGASSKGELDDVTIRVIRLETEIEIGAFLAGARGNERTIDIGSDGRYKVRFASSQPILLRVQIFQTPRKQLTKGETHELLQARSLWVADVTEPEQPRFTFSAGEKDVLYITSSSSAFDILKYRVVQTGDLEWVKAGTPFQVAATGKYTIQFLIEGESERILIFDKTQKGTMYDDILVRRFVHDPDAGQEAQATSINEEDIAVDPNAAMNNSMQEMMAEMNRQNQQRQRESEQTITEIMNAIVELNRKDTVMTSAIFNPVEKLIPGVPPKFDFRSQNRRQCYQIGDLKTRDPVLWAFYVAVGHEAYEEFKERDRETMRFRGKSPLHLFAESQADRTPYSLSPKSEENMMEVLEMAIVDASNKENFEQGKSYTEFGRTRATSGELRPYDYGVRPVPQDDLYFCVCNHNRTSPVDVGLFYETFKFEEEQ